MRFHHAASILLHGWNNALVLHELKTKARGGAPKLKFMTGVFVIKSAGIFKREKFFLNFIHRNNDGWNLHGIQMQICSVIDIRVHGHG